MQGVWQSLKKGIWHGKSTESIGLKVNIAKTKVMKCDTNKGPLFASGKYLCSEYKKGVGRNSVYSSLCKSWIDKRWSGFKGKLIDTQNFEFHCCLYPPEIEKEAQEIELDNFGYKRLDVFCYLGDMLGPIVAVYYMW